MRLKNPELFEKILIISCVITLILAGFLYWHSFDQGKLNPEEIPSKVIEQVLEAEKEGRIEITTMTITSFDSTQTVDTINYKIKLPKKK